MKNFLRASLPALCLCALFAVAGAQSRSLDGTWQFAVDREGKLTIDDLSSVKDWREIRVPLSWNAQFADLRDYRGVAWYRKNVDLQPIKSDQAVLLKFGAVDYFAEVFVNGQKAGEHEGGYLPFTLNVGKLVKAGANEIAVRVTDPDNDKARWGEMSYNELPHGKQSWYVQTGGIWQPVSLEIRPSLYIERVHITTTPTGDVTIEVKLAGESRTDPGYQVTVRNAKGEVEFTNGGGGIMVNPRGFYGRVKSPLLWSPNNPVLYSVEVLISEFTDLNWECNGLLDMFRNKKIYADDLARLQQQDVIFARAPVNNYVSGARIELTTYVSRYSPAAEREQTIQLFLDSKKIGEAKIKRAERGSVVKDETIALTAPAVTKPSNIRLRLELRETSPSDSPSGKGALVAENYLELFIYPEPKKRSGSVCLAGGLSHMAEALRSAGYDIVPSPGKGFVTLIDKIPQEAQSLFGPDYRFIVLADDKDALPHSAVKITPRNGSTGYDGNWVTNFNWANVNRAPFNAVSFDKLLGFEAEEVTPKFVIEGVKAEDYDDVMSGIFLGWVNKNAALMVGGRIQGARAIITTFRLAGAYGKDEYASRLLDEMIRLVAAEGFEPKLKIE